MRNKTAQNDKYGQGSLSTRPLRFYPYLEFLPMPRKTHPGVGHTQAFCPYYAAFSLIASSL